MPPMYKWVDETTGTEVQVIRRVADIEVPPTAEELADQDTEVDMDNAKWRRTMCAQLGRWRYND